MEKGWVWEPVSSSPRVSWGGELVDPFAVRYGVRGWRLGRAADVAGVSRAGSEREVEVVGLSVGSGAVACLLG